MQDILEKNLDKLKTIYDEIYDKIKQMESEKPDNDEKEYKIIHDQSMNGEDILGVVMENSRILYLNSRYNDDEFSDHWVEQYRDNQFKEVFIVFGLSNFRAAKKLVDITKSTNPIMLYEPDVDIFYQSIQKNDITEILEERRVILCVKDVNDKYYIEFIQSAVTYQNLHLIRYCCMPNYVNLYSKEWHYIIDNLKSSMLNIVVTRNTLLGNSKDMMLNNLYNLEDFACQHSFNQLKAAFSDVDKNIVPAMIVSAGPSLDKNVELIKDAKNKAFIIAVDTAIKPLLNKNIIPDLVVTIDMLKYPIIFMHTKFKNIPILVAPDSNKELIPLYSGKRFYAGKIKSYFNSLYQELKGELLLPVETGGSVAHNAFSAALFMGFKKIILVGQDLAYTGEKLHADSSFGKMDDDKRQAIQKYIQVKDIYGNMVDTDESMDLYRRWFERQIERYNLKNIIDATEGGAKIEGTKVMTLKEAIACECTQNINIQKIIDDIEPQFSEQQQNEILERISHMDEELLKTEEKLLEGIENYKKLREFYQSDIVEAEELKDLVRQIGELSEYVDKAPILSLVAFYNAKNEYEVLAEVYHLKESQKEEIEDIAEKGIKMLQGYVEGIHKLVKDIKDKNHISIDKVKGSVWKLRESICRVKEKWNDGEVDNIDTYMKDFYDYYMKLVNKMKIYVQNRTGDNSDYHQLMKRLWTIVEFHEKEDYTNLLSNMMELDTYISEML